MAAGREVVIVEAVRTPIGRRNGGLAGVHPVNLAAHVLREIVGRAGIDPVLVDDIVLGCVIQAGEQALNIARTAALAADFPISVPATTVDRQCGSGQWAVHVAANLIRSGDAEIAIAGGVESMTRQPMGSSVTPPASPYPPGLRERYNLTHQGIAAEKLVKRWDLTRAELDAFSLESHRRAHAAQQAGYFDREIAPVTVSTPDGDVVVRADEGVRADTSLERLASLKPAFIENGTITAGNSSQISDGAAALLLTSEAKARELGLRPRARIVAQLVVGSDPELMLTGPIVATPKILERAGLRLDEVDLYEVNEAFAPVVLAWQRETGADPARTNVNGGAIALGHPLGASGARIMTGLLHELERRGARYGYQTMCCGGGLGTATIIERLD